MNTFSLIISQLIFQSALQFTIEHFGGGDRPPIFQKRKIAAALFSLTENNIALVGNYLLLVRELPPSRRTLSCRAI